MTCPTDERRGALLLASAAEVQGHLLTAEAKRMMTAWQLQRDYAVHIKLIQDAVQKLNVALCEYLLMEGNEG